MSPRSARGARGAVAALFFCNGALFSNVVPRFPDLKAGLDLSNAALGSGVAAAGAGALLVGFVAGLVVRRWGSARVAPLSTLAIAGNLVLVGAAPSWLTLAAALFVAGALDSMADVAANAHGLRVERLYGRSILNSLHGVWSIGAVVGGAMGAIAAGIALPVVWHLAIAAVLFGSLAVVASRFLLPGPDHVAAAAAAYDPERRASWSYVRLAGSVIALGVIAAMAQAMEDTGATWSPIYLREDLGADAAVGGLGFVVLQASQTVGRLLGDRLVTRFGDRVVARAGATLAGVSMAAALAAPAVATTVLAFGAVGLGIGTLIPGSLRRAEELPGLSGGMGITAVGSVLRASVIATPPLIGLAADTFGLRAGLLAIPIAAGVVIVLAGVLPTSLRSIDQAG